MSDKTYAFVTACGRSGTTALTGLLNRHPDVLIGFERFSKKLKQGKFGPHLYTADRFADVRDEDTHPFSVNRHRGMENLQGKAASAQVIGDKIPGLFGHFDLLEGFGRARVIHILREPFGIARSCEDRALNPEDSWPAHYGYRTAVDRFNASLAAINRARDLDLLDIFVVSYEDLFATKTGMKEMFDFLGVDPDRLGPVDDIFAKANKLAERGRLSEIAQYTARHADFDAYRHAMQFATPKQG